MFKVYQNLNLKIGLSLFGCAEKYTEQSTHCAVWMRRWVFKWSTRPNDLQLLNSLPFTFTVYHISMFLPHMLSETTRFCTCVITFCALVWLFSSVNADVPLQSSCSVEWAPALLTVMWLLSTVGEKMLGKIFFCDWRKFVPRTPSIVKGNKSLSLVWSKWGSQWWGILKHFPRSRCIFFSHWSREMKYSSIII